MWKLTYPQRGWAPRAGSRGGQWSAWLAQADVAKEIDLTQIRHPWGEKKIPSATLMSHNTHWTPKHFNCTGLSSCQVESRFGGRHAALRSLRLRDSNSKAKQKIFLSGSGRCDAGWDFRRDAKSGALIGRAVAAWPTGRRLRLAPTNCGRLPLQG